MHARVLGSGFSSAEAEILGRRWFIAFDDHKQHNIPQHISFQIIHPPMFYGVWYRGIASREARVSSREFEV